MNSPSGPPRSSDGASRQPSQPRQRTRAQVALDVALLELVREARLLPYVTPRDAPRERRRLAEELARGRTPTHRFRWSQRPDPTRLRAARRTIERLHREARGMPGAVLYQRRLSELDLDVMILEALGTPKALRPLVARRFGDGRAKVGRGTLEELAESLLGDVQADAESPSVSSEELAHRARRAALDVGMRVEVKIDARLASSAAAGERTMFVARRAFGEVEARRLIVHEVYGHLLSAFNARAQPLGIASAGVAGAFEDQEGVCLALEELAGVLDGTRLRTLAARVLVTRWVHEGRPFGNSARTLIDAYGFSPRAAVRLSERGYRGGGVARDAIYLRSFLSVRRAIRERPLTLPRLLLGKLSLSELPDFEALAEEGWATLEPAYELPSSFSRSLEPTGSGTNCVTSPPSLQTSLQRFEET